MEKNSFIEYILKNKYVILCVTIVFILAVTGIIEKLMIIIFTLILLGLAIYIGKKLQEDDGSIKGFFDKNKSKVEYTVKKEDKKKE